MLMDNTSFTRPSPLVLHEDWDLPQRENEAHAGAQFVVDVEGFEGPLDLLLAMARTQKVDLADVSVLALSEQYLAFVAEARRVHLELAADYLVMAAWLTYLKSRLLLPREEAADNEPAGEELAQRLAFRLKRLEAMREAADSLMARNHLGRDVFARGRPEAIATSHDIQYAANLFDVLQAYAEQRKRMLPRVHVVKKRTVWSIKDARLQLERLVGHISAEWLQLDRCLEECLGTDRGCRSAIASSLGAALEMAREGLVDVRQNKPFGPVLVRRREPRAVCEKVDS